MTLPLSVSSSPHYGFLHSSGSFREFIATWEAGRLPKAEWTHAAHVAIGAAYAVRHRSDAFDRMKAGILRHNEAVGTVNGDSSGYHETLTRLWALVLAKLVKPFSDPWTAACVAVEAFGEKRDLHCLYYSFDAVRSVEARRNWIPPDLNGPY